jgi:fumarate hydratase subunit beta
MSDASLKVSRTLKAPVTVESLKDLTIGQKVLLNGQIYAARDQAHRRLVALIEAEQQLPFELEGQIVYYMGPSPPPPGRVIGAAGPTTSGRMDRFTLPLLAKGLKVMVGKGRRNERLRKDMLKHSAVYLAAVGGAGALYGQCIKTAEVVAWPELGPEAVFRLTVADMPTLVINDLSGNDLYLCRDNWKH